MAGWTCGPSAAVALVVLAGGPVAGDDWAGSRRERFPGGGPLHRIPEEALMARHDGGGRRDSAHGTGRAIDFRVHDRSGKKLHGAGGAANWRSSPGFAAQLKAAMAGGATATPDRAGTNPGTTGSGRLRIRGISAEPPPPGPATPRRRSGDRRRATTPGLDLTIGCIVIKGISIGFRRECRRHRGRGQTETQDGRPEFNGGRIAPGGRHTRAAPEVPDQPAG